MNGNAAAGPSRLSRPQASLDIPPPQVCPGCHRDWPIAEYYLFPDGSRDTARTHCIRCTDPVREQELWSVMLLEMHRRMLRAREREPERQRRAKAKMAEAKAFHKAEKKRYEKEQLDFAKAAHERAKAAVEHAKAHNPSLLVHPSLTASGGPSYDVHSALAPTSLRLAPEPLRSSIWLKMFYTPSARPSDNVTQSAVFSHYFRSIGQPIPILQPPGQSLPAGAYVKYPPPVRRGTDFIASIPEIFPTVKISREGFLCVGLRERDVVERAEVWKQIQKFMAERGLGGADTDGHLAATGLPIVPLPSALCSTIPQAGVLPAKATTSVVPAASTRPPVSLPGQNYRSLDRFVATSAVHPSAPKLPIATTKTPAKISGTERHVSTSQSSAGASQRSAKRKRLDLSSNTAARPSSPASSASTVLMDYSLGSAPQGHVSTPQKAGPFDPFALRPPGSGDYVEERGPQSERTLTQETPTQRRGKVDRADRQ